MAPLPGVTPVRSSQVTDQGVLEARSIGEVNPGHAQYSNHSEAWPSAFGLGYQATAYGPEVSQDAYNQETGSGSIAGDRTPSTHRSPYPRGILSVNLDAASYAEVADSLAVQRRILHGRDLGASRVLNRNSPAGREVPAHYTTDRYDAPNGNILGKGVPGQVAGSGNALKDPDQGFGRLNDLDEFQRGHSVRRVQHDTVHFDRSLDYAKPQPFWGRHEIREARFNGPDSPYQVLGDTSTGQQVVWEGRIGYPTEYVQPPEPAILPASQQEDVWAYGW